MKVIFVIQGEGRGHLTQALALKQMMEREGHEVVKMLVGKSKMRELPSFFVNQAGCPMEQFYSPNFLPAKDNRRCGLLRSIAYNISLTPTYLSSILYIRNQVRKSGAESVSVSPPLVQDAAAPHVVWRYAEAVYPFHLSARHQYAGSLASQLRQKTCCWNEGSATTVAV